MIYGISSCQGSVNLKKDILILKEENINKLIYNLISVLKNLLENVETWRGFRTFKWSSVTLT